MIVIPMAGMSKRFTDKGYTQPKFMLKLQDRFVFDYAVLSFEKYFNQELIRFIFVQNPETKQFIQGRCEVLGLKKFDIVELPKPTAGQADTVYQGTQDTENERLLIFNIDTFNFGFKLPSDMEKLDGSLECFIGEGEQWSFVQPKSPSSHLVSATAEKKRISEFCSTGFYHFKSARLFKEVFQYAKSNNLTAKGEYYIAPLYNRVIETGGQVGYFLNDRSSLVFCGTPDEYEQCQKIDVENLYKKTRRL